MIEKDGRLNLLLLAAESSDRRYVSRERSGNLQPIIILAGSDMHTPVGSGP